MDDVAAYYDRNTDRFLRYGGGADVAAIHRQIWAPGVHTRAEAFQYLNTYVRQQVADCLPDLPLLDLGCGVGGTACGLAASLERAVLGVSNSAVHVAQASARAARLGLSERCRFIQADFLTLPECGPIGAAYAIESFIHARQAAGFFAAAGRVVARGGRLVICDDFLTSPGLWNKPAAGGWLRQLVSGWRLHNLGTTAEAVEQAKQAGFRLLEEGDLSAYTRSWPRLLLYPAALATRLRLPSMYWDNLSGGTALQVCLLRGWTKYQTLVFIKE